MCSVTDTGTAIISVKISEDKNCSFHWPQTEDISSDERQILIFFNTFSCYKNVLINAFYFSSLSKREAWWIYICPESWVVWTSSPFHHYFVLFLQYVFKTDLLVGVSVWNTGNYYYIWPKSDINTSDKTKLFSEFTSSMQLLSCH